MKWLIIIICFLIVIVAWCFADFLLGRHYLEKEWRKREYPFRQGEIQLITNGPELFDSYFADLRKATSGIHVLFYIVKNDLFSEKFFELLIEKAQQGVKVRLLLDWFGSRKASKDLILKARQTGVEVSFCHKPRFPFFFFSMQQRNHRKITIIDGKQGYLGGFNVGKEYINLDPTLSPWRDYHLRIEGEGVADLQREFSVDYKRATGKPLPDDPDHFPPLKTGSMKHYLFPTEGVGADRHLLQLFDQAQKSIFIGTPYFIPPEKLIASLEGALKRGVSVTILVPENSDHFIVKEASFRYLRRILSLGGTVCQFQNGFFHAKVLLIDENVCDIGTANFDYRSLHLNHEINCFIYDKKFIADVSAAISEDIGLSSKLTLDDLKDLRMTLRVKEWVGKVCKGLL